MIELKKEMKECRVIEAKVCDKCGRRIIRENVDKGYQSEIYEWQEFYHINFCGGYGSVFGDGETVKIDLCQYCLKEILENYGLWKLSEGVIFRKKDKTIIYNYIKKWNGNPISYSYLASLSTIDESEVRKLCRELESEKLIDSNKTLVWVKR